jgi:hypothetical protein
MRREAMMEVLDSPEVLGVLVAFGVDLLVPFLSLDDLEG